MSSLGGHMPVVFAQATGPPPRSTWACGVRACVQQAQGTGGVCMTSEGCARETIVKSCLFMRL